LISFLNCWPFFASQKVLTYIWRKKFSSNFFASTTVWKVKVGTIFWVNYMWSFSQVKWIRKGILPQTFPWRMLVWLGLWNVSNLFCKHSYYFVLKLYFLLNLLFGMPYQEHLKINYNFWKHFWESVSKFFAKVIIS